MPEAMTKSLLSVAALALLLNACAGAAHPQASSVPSRSACRGGSVQGDAELAKLEGCVSIEGDVSISAVSTLAPLATLKSVTGTLAIGPTHELTTLSGLEGLESARGVVLEHNASLINARALNGLLETSRVEVSHNPRLSKSLGFLEGLAMRDTKLELFHNVGLEAEGMKDTVPAERGLEIASLGR
jgi:hypothetical protein